ncbi:TPA: restriction endonuclease subunit S [Stenotrophomonas maltophilia]|nr:restriction endonuclease subunit S [Stenotrophomonas maltophilia]
MPAKDWQTKKLRELVASAEAGVSVNSEDRPAGPQEFGVLKISSVTEGVFKPEENKVIRAEELQRAVVNPQADRILVSRSNTEALVGASAYVDHDHPQFFLPDKLWQLQPAVNGRVHMRWLSYWLSSEATRSSLSKLATGTSGSMKNIGKDQLLSLPVPVPPIREQRRIAQILSSWDQAIATTERLLANSQRCTRDLMASMLSGHRRFAEFSDKWRFVDLDTVFERVTCKNSTQNTNVMTISGEHGLISQRDYFKKSVASANLSGYTLLHRYDFAYNKSYSAGYPMGAIKPLLAYDAGVVSSLYLCFKLREDVDADFDFFRHYFEAGLLNQELEGIAQEGARNHGLLNVSVTDFFKLQLHIPTAPEQRRISEVINVARSEEARLQAQVQALRQEKVALMSQLLTGKRRVKLPDSETEVQA